MNAIERIFNLPRVLLPVIHPVSEAAAMASLHRVVEAGCRGVFLINQGMDAPAVLSLARQAKKEYPWIWVGLNLLGHSLEWSYGIINASQLDGMWADNTEVTQAGISGLFDHISNRPGYSTLFGGVAFKYQTPVAFEDLRRTAQLASVYVDVVTTSGPGTGQAADLNKIKEMKLGVGSKALGLASGVTLENVELYKPYVSAFLVGTGIEQSLGVIDLAKATELRRAIEETTP